MILTIFNKSKRLLKKYEKEVKKINKEYEQIKELTDEELRNKAMTTTDRIERMAIVKEACSRTMNMTPYDVQLIGALSIIDKNISEMKTGEGKSLTAALAATFLGLEKRRVYVVTVNDYLVARDAKEHDPLFTFFELTVGAIVSYNNFPEYKMLEYSCNIIYGTATELGFDYLRDNLVYSKKEKKQKELDFIIVDEIDSILIDEATTPMIISEKVDSDNGELFKIDKIAKSLKRGTEIEVKEGLSIDKKVDGDFILNEKDKSIYLTEEGIKKVEEALNIENLYNLEVAKYVIYIENALMANFYYKESVHYIVKNGEIVLIDESTGRLTPGRQLSDGQHQAIEAKEKILISPFTIVKGEISYQKFFLLFKDLSGMTGTAVTEAQEFSKIYNLEVIEIPTNKPIQRIDKNDILFLTKEDKLKHFVKEVLRIHKTGQPILIGTTSVKTNELLEKELKKNGLSINVLNAKNAEEESEIISKAGTEKAITLATNMAGRGVDIKLTEKAKELGGLYVIGFERYSNRRIDNQLRGRSGRQGNPGVSQFFVSFEDDLIKVFGNTKKMSKRLKVLGVGENENLLEGKMFSKVIEKAQKTIENQNFELRKNLVKFDNVVEVQRNKMFEIRNQLLEDFNPSEKINDLIDFGVEKVFQYKYMEEEAIKENIERYLKINTENGIPKEKGELKLFLSNIIGSKFEIFEGNINDITSAVRYIYLRNLDAEWIEHLTIIDNLRNGIHLRGYNQKDPLVEFQKESYYLFQELLENIKLAILVDLIYLNIKKNENN